MASLRNAIIVGVSALGVSVGSMPAQAGPASPSKSSERTVAGYKMSDIMPVGRRGGRGWGGGGGRHFGGGRSWGGGRSFAGRGWRGGGGRYYRGNNWNGRYVYRGRGYRGGYRYGGYRGYRGYRYGGYRGYRGYRYGYRRHGYGGYYAAGILGLAAGAALASPYYGDYGYGGYYGYDRCRVVRHRRDYYGRPIRVIRYVPC